MRQVRFWDQLNHIYCQVFSFGLGGIGLSLKNPSLACPCPGFGTCAGQGPIARVPQQAGSIAGCPYLRSLPHAHCILSFARSAADALPRHFQLGSERYRWPKLTVAMSFTLADSFAVSHEVFVYVRDILCRMRIGGSYPSHSNPKP